MEKEVVRHIHKYTKAMYVMVSIQRIKKKIFMNHLLFWDVSKLKMKQKLHGKQERQRINP